MKLNTLTTGLIYPALLFAMFIALFVVPAFAEDISIDMLNKRDDGAKMVYSEDVTRIDIGDTIKVVDFAVVTSGNAISTSFSLNHEHTHVLAPLNSKIVEQFHNDGNVLKIGKLAP